MPEADADYADAVLCQDGLDEVDEFEDPRGGIEGCVARAGH